MLLLWLASCILRVWIAPHTLFAEDERRIFEMTHAFYSGGPLPITGAAVVYSGTSIPGSLLALVAGLPLWLSHGHPFGTAFAVAMANSIGTLLIYWALRPHFRAIPEWIFSAWIFFSPWSLMMSSAVNPHFLLPLSALWLWAISGSEGPRSQLKSFAIACVVTLMAQLHLSFAAVAATTLSVWLVVDRRLPKALGLVAGAFFGGLTLIPWIIHNLSQRLSGDVTPGIVAANSGLHLELDRPLQFFSRLLTFPTADISRFIEAGHGYKGVALLFGEQSWIILPAVIALAGSLLITLASLRSAIARRRERLFKIYWLAVACTSVLFLFSIKGPSAHTFWIWFPLSFAPALAAADQIRWNLRLQTLAGVYLVSSLIFALGVQVRADRMMEEKNLRVMDWTKTSQTSGHLGSHR